MFLLQVNGTLVTHSNHVEVVKLIKCKFQWQFYIQLFVDMKNHRLFKRLTFLKPTCSRLYALIMHCKTCHKDV